MKKFLIALFTVLLGASGAWAAEKAEATVVTAKGEAAINGNLAAARERAKEVAMREAVNQVVGATVSSVSEMEDYTLVRDLVFTTTSGYVSEVSFVSEQVDQANDLLAATYQVKVAKGEIDKDAAAIATLLSMKGQKRIYVMVKDISTETVGEGAAQTATVVSSGSFETILRGAFRKDGFLLLDPNLAKGKLRVDSALQPINSPQEARELGNAVGADLVVYGNVTGTHTQGSVADQPICAVVLRSALTVVAPNSGEILADYSGIDQGLGAHNCARASSNSMEKAAKSATEVIRSKLYAAWRKQATGSQTLTVEVTGVQFSDFAAFKSLMENGVGGVKAVSSSRLEGGVGRYDVQFSGSAESLATALSGKAFRGKTLNVTALSGNTVGLALGK